MTLLSRSLLSNIHCGLNHLIGRSVQEVAQYKRMSLSRWQVNLVEVLTGRRGPEVRTIAANSEVCPNQQPPKRGGAVPEPVCVGSKWLLALPRVQVTPSTASTQVIFSPCCPLNNRRIAARNLFEIGCLFSLFSCPSIHSSPCPDEQLRSS